MATAKKYFHDRVVLLLVSTNAFLAVMGGLFILFRLGSTHSTGLIVEYRQNLGLSAYKPGGSSTFLAFILFLLAVFIFHLVLSRKVYHMRRQFALAVLGMATLLIVLAIVASSALLSL